MIDEAIANNLVSREKKRGYRVTRSVTARALITSQVAWILFCGTPHDGTTRIHHCVGPVKSIDIIGVRFIGSLFTSIHNVGLIGFPELIVLWVNNKQVTIVGRRVTRVARLAFDSARLGQRETRDLREGGDWFVNGSSTKGQLFPNLGNIPNVAAHVLCVVGGGEKSPPTYVVTAGADGVAGDVDGGKRRIVAGEEVEGEVDLEDPRVGSPLAAVEPHHRRNDIVRVGVRLGAGDVLVEYGRRSQETPRIGSGEKQGHGPEQYHNDKAATTQRRLHGEVWWGWDSAECR